jgi:hypothetical protein
MLPGSIHGGVALRRNKRRHHSSRLPSIFTKSLPSQKFCERPHHTQFDSPEPSALQLSTSSSNHLPETTSLPSPVPATAEASPRSPPLALQTTTHTTWDGFRQDRRMRGDPRRHQAAHSSHQHDQHGSNATPHATPSSNVSTRTMCWTA